MATIPISKSQGKTTLDEEIEDVTALIGESADDQNPLGDDDELIGSDTDASSTADSKSQSEGDASDDDIGESDISENDDEDYEGQKKNDDEDDDDEGPVIPKTAKQIKDAKKRAASKKNAEDDLSLLGVPHGLNFDDDDDVSDESDKDNEDEEYFQKLKSDVRQNFAEIYHPESFSHNYDEIQTLSRVIRNSSGVIIDDLHRTVPFMTKYEKTRILGQRAKQINEGAPPLIKIDTTVIDGYLIAVKELEQKKTPFIIRRPLPNGGSEYWRVQDLEILV
jgi:DNA-directed RNA polymerase I, II, and III subunit RPABC2